MHHTRRGRPRPQNVIARDTQILSLIRTGPKTRNALAAAIGCPAELVYLSLDRLRRQGEIRYCVDRDGQRVWQYGQDAPCP